MEKFIKFDSTIMPLNIENIDTDQIIPARFLKAVTRDGFGDNLFRDWRYDNNDNLIENFNLNSINNDSKILLAGRNFGCGSSREHAAWAIYDYGFRVVVSSFFADIFRNNALNNGLLVIQLSQNKIDQIFDKVSNDINTVFSVDLNDQKFYSSDGTIDEEFEINEYNKTCLINGYDNIDYLLSVKDKILKFESNLK
ncbi:MAG: 3-isopropylmalate dehydratase small subunit [Bacteroidota bacterium]|jgi:3-isopropylmalate/(R)-2-methylmalate dehydratase small subunit|nr:3-isopropylmalate dehydratase small subunit [Bacteroidota bacterium]MEC8679229.1 3-isopropylmalate dehydratase small subunit [Bacteroidota bacterium]MEC8701843.1 3-isopropylmalate dehydratase small subunit [Bacteroidota bacterium]|tara:strand:+ start:1628 stop:2215 length:588 start_codon:yes stop_codon:yes gene_type:complete